MAIAIVTGSLGLVGSEAATHFAHLGMEVIGIDNRMREKLFGHSAKTERRAAANLLEEVRYSHEHLDIRSELVNGIFKTYGQEITLVVHAAAQPSHDWAASNPTEDWSINANATQKLLEATRQFCPEAVFIFLSTNKVYGDLVNGYRFEEEETRWEHCLPDFAVPECLAVDQSMHSLFGASKLAADILVQEYGRYFDMKTVCFRCGCITGPNHAGVEAHGFLSYLMKCYVTGTRYKVYGYKGKQVRDNIHSADLVKAFELFFANPRYGEVYNMGGGRESNCSIIEASNLAIEIASRDCLLVSGGEPRRGDHIWWISDTSKFKSDYPDWKITRTVPDILKELYEAYK